MGYRIRFDNHTFVLNSRAVLFAFSFLAVCNRVYVFFQTYLVFPSCIQQYPLHFKCLFLHL
ncbi:hypothetical protein CLOSTMETH_02366 [[Clostridium] methylpentosum DSM 5476]|uniref:Uncharacterized protein n=1 Tax=[Clostridium] methylpentosum DSM 5476 TaxID=537013 RepID=C0EES7_9FIRM|nr:hypothetical protein CLOSTMETH_02366 [[Clostridium] methylpentosum DSM 5476]